jgi:hypothetical protein
MNILTMSKNTHTIDTSFLFIKKLSTSLSLHLVSRFDISSFQFRIRFYDAILSKQEISIYEDLFDIEEQFAN